MTKKFKLNLILGLITWGFLAFSPNISYAANSGMTMDEISAKAITLNGNEFMSAQAVRLAGDDFAKEVAKANGYDSDNIRAFNSKDAGEQIVGVHAKGALNAAQARWKGSRNFFTGAWNVVTGGARDLFRDDEEIANALADYANDSNK